ncbi:hypothetical protein JCM14720_09900 [Calditerricola yamamurae]
MQARTPLLPWQPEHGKRDAILTSAYNTFAEFGYANTKIETIAERAGVGKGTVYLYFKNKNDLFRQMIQELIDWHLSILREQITGPHSALDRLRTLLRVHLTMLAGRTYPFHLHGRDIGHVDDELHLWLREQKQRFLEDLRQLIEEGIAEGAFRTVCPRLAALWLFATLNVTLIDDAALSTEQVAGLIELVEHGLRASNEEHPTPIAG